MALRVQLVILASAFVDYGLPENYLRMQKCFTTMPKGI